MPFGDAPTTDGPRLLVLDDDAAIGRLVGRVARAAGFVPAITAEPSAFHREIAAAVPQVVALDLQLGTSDGVEQLRALAEHHYPGAIILMSGFDTRVLATARSLAVSLGLRVVAALSKPLEIQELRETLRRLRSQTAPLDPERILQALREDEMVLEYQPIVTRLPRGLRKLEALIRWRHPDLGRVEPGRFIPLAEGHPATAAALTDWVIARAAADYLRLRAHGVAVPIAVNMSPRAVLDLTFPDRVEQTLRSAGMPGHQLCIEITETAALQELGTAMDVLSRLRLKGVQLAIDDFGTGSSSLTLLRQLPFSVVKIDSSFVADMTTSRDAQAIVRSIIDLTRNMELENIAEGVETEETAVLLEKLGVDMVQGYLIARPMPPDEIPAWLDLWLGLPTEDIRADAAAPGTMRSDPAARSETLASADQDGAVSGPHLSRRQTEVMHLIAEGSSVKQIARTLDLSVGSVKTYLAQAYAVLGAHNRVEALRQVGMVLPPGSTADSAAGGAAPPRQPPS